jgi:trk system potassium uptake protein TrkA
MKSALVIGLGRFGTYLSRKFMALGNEVMAVDQSEAAVNSIMDEVTSAQIADCKNEEALRSLGVTNFDLCFVCVGNRFQDSLEVTSLLKELGARRVIAKAHDSVHAKFLLRNGADEVVYPERDSAERVAARLSANNVFDYIELTPDFSIYEIPPMEAWLGRTVQEVDVRKKYGVNILATKRNGELSPLPGGSHLFMPGEHLLVLGRGDDVKRILKKI